ncbi:hypothetical protein B0H13DRAFT_1591439 [Mycena leptocephala]|nr:hypothetical protein B0H13DRAFT_1591439 [Mycena leptocephala]
MERPHGCPVCKRRFDTNGDLARHARVHTGERNHSCPFPGCEKKFAHADNLTNTVYFFGCGCGSVFLEDGKCV